MERLAGDRDRAGGPDLKTLERLLKQEQDIPALPQVVLRVRQTLDDHGSTARALAEVILQDPSLTARILRMANSVYYRRSQGRVTTVTHAIVVIGFETIRNLTLGLAVYGALARRWSQGVLRSFWRDSLCAAIVCQHAAELQGRRVPEEAFVAGLLHDLGKLVLWVYAEPVYRQVEQAVARGTHRIAAERTALGYDHGQAGELLARQWQLPDVIQTSVRYHHEEDRGSCDTRTAPYFDLLMAADAVAANLYGYPWERAQAPPERVHAKLAAVCPMSDKEFVGFHGGLDARIHEFAKIADIQIGPEGAGASEPAELHAADDPLRRRGAQIALLGEMTNLFLARGEQDALLSFLLSGLQRIYGAEAASFALWSPAAATLLVTHTLAGPVPAAARREVECPDLASGLRGIEVVSRPRHFSFAREGACACVLAAPVSGGGAARAAFLLEWPDHLPALDTEDHSFLRLVGGQLALFLDRLEAPTAPPPGGRTQGR